MKPFSQSISSSTLSHLSDPDCSDDLDGAQSKARTHRTLAPNLTRRSHKKSRGGCFNCKSRKIKVCPSSSVQGRDSNGRRRSGSNQISSTFQLPGTNILCSVKSLVQAVKTAQPRSLNARIQRKQTNTSNGAPVMVLLP